MSEKKGDRIVTVNLDAMAREVKNTPNIDYLEKVKYPLARSWNMFVEHMQKAREEWIKLQEEMNTVGRTELENYPIVAQKHIGRFRNVNFEWMASMFVDYYRGAGGLESMYIILPPEPKEEKKNGSKKD